MIIDAGDFYRCRKLGPSLKPYMSDLTGLLYDRCRLPVAVAFSRRRVMSGSYSRPSDDLYSMALDLQQ